MHILYNVAHSAVSYFVPVRHVFIALVRHSMLDAAEVLIGSIRRACSSSSYRCETVAFVLPAIGQDERALVEDMGWR